MNMDMPVKFFKGEFLDSPIITRLPESLLVIAPVERGSGNVRYSLESWDIVDGVLTLNVRRGTPPILTMDYVSWLVSLEICLTNYVNHVNVKLV